jgi:hypothetical protein
MEKLGLCRCNKCYSILIDENPQIDAPLFELRGDEIPMDSVLIGHGYFWGCPNCKTDEYLTDLHECTDIDEFYKKQL